VPRSEAELVKWLQSLWHGRVAGLSLGIGDDAALVRVRRKHELILTTDLSIEGVHFLQNLHPPRSVGHRALARGLSDIAAMGGTPRFVLLSLALSKEASKGWLEDFYDGVRSLARRQRVEIVGGDTSHVPRRSFVDVVVTGEIPAGLALRRSGARPGDRVFVSGCLGLSALGLRLLKAGLGASRPDRAIAAHLYPQPRIGLGRFLSQNRLASALMDLSDGLSSDLARLCQASGVGAAIEAAPIFKPAATAQGRLSPARALDLALHGGEDYELLFTVPPRKLKSIPAKFHGLPVTCIGEIQRGKSVTLVLPDGTSRPLPPGGWDHFRASRRSGRTSRP
jgi:thiamine-monophosphate kinase